MRRQTTHVGFVVRSAAIGLVLAFGALPVHAAMITGDLTFSGDWDTSGPLGSATFLTFPGNDFDVDGATGDFSGIAQGDIGTINDFGWVSSGASAPLLSIAGFFFDAVSINVVAQNDMFLLLEGTGFVSGNGFEATAADFVMSANVAGPLKVMSGGISAQPIPLPGALLLFASAMGILGLRRR